MSSERKPRDRLAVLDDYVSGHMGDDEAASYEEELFAEAAGNDEPNDDLAFLDRLARFAPYLVARHTYETGATRAQVDAMLRSGRHIAYVDVGRGDVPALRYSRSAEQLVLRLEVDLAGIDKVDVEIEAPGQGILKTMRDVAFDPRDGALFACCEMPLAVASAEAGATWRIVGFAEGRARTLAEVSIPTELTD